MRDREHKEAKWFMQWVQSSLQTYPQLESIYHIPNGGQRNAVVAAKLKAEGTKAGMPDYHLPFAANGCHGLWIELKAEGGYPTKKQKEVHKMLRSQGHDVRVCVGWHACAEAVKDYLGVSQ
jgi:hypothetical protein